VALQSPEQQSEDFPYLTFHFSFLSLKPGVVGYQLLLGGTVNFVGWWVPVAREFNEK